MAHLHPTAELAERALLPDDPGQALALTRVLFAQTPRMFNHHRGLWGYTGMASDGAPLTVQSTGIGGASAAVVVGELAAAGAVIACDGASRALGAARRLVPDAALTRALRGDREGELASVDLPESAPPAGAGAFALESAAVLAPAARAGIPAARLVAG